MSSCYTLKRDNTWTKYPSLPQERALAASSKIHQGSSLWVLGGIDKYGYGQKDTITLEHGTWRVGPPLTSYRTGACAVTLNNGTVILTGGTNGTNLDSVELFSFHSMTWTSL